LKLKKKLIFLIGPSTAHFDT
jgi:hypothetical protein